MVQSRTHVLARAASPSTATDDPARAESPARAGRRAAGAAASTGANGSRRVLCGPAWSAEVHLAGRRRRGHLAARAAPLCPDAAERDRLPPPAGAARRARWPGARRGRRGARRRGAAARVGALWLGPPARGGTLSRWARAGKLAGAARGRSAEMASRSVRVPTGSQAGLSPGKSSWATLWTGPTRRRSAGKQGANRLARSTG